MNHYHSKIRIIGNSIPIEELSKRIEEYVKALPTGAYDIKLEAEEAEEACLFLALSYKLPMTDLEISAEEKHERQNKLRAYNKLKLELGL
jgi:hypothetical protein